MIAAMMQTTIKMATAPTMVRNLDKKSVQLRVGMAS
jgi:hypothetical protein